MSYGAIQYYSEPSDIRVPVAGLKIQVTVNQCAGYAASARVLQLDRMCLAFAQDNAAKTAHVQVPADQVMFALLPSPQQGVTVCGFPFQRGTIMQHAPGWDYHHTSEGPSSSSVLFVSPADLSAVAEAHGFDAPCLDGTTVIAPRPHSLPSLQRLHASAMRLVQDAPEVIGRPEAMHGLVQALMGALANCLQGADVKEASAAQRSHGRILTQFEDLLAARANQNVFMSDICAELGISARSLRFCCDEHLGMGPKHFLMLRRLHLVRRALLEGAAESTAVTGAATEFGFWELGRFSVAYRAVFGESPSVTLRRQPREAGPAGPGNGARLTSAAGDWLKPNWQAALAWLNRAGLEDARCIAT